MDSTILTLTEDARSELIRFQRSAGRGDARIRLAVVDGGCEGWSYDWQFVTELDPGDICVNCAGLTVLVRDRDSAYLSGVTVHYSEDLVGGGFRFENPNARSHCHCSGSFSTQ